MNKRTLTALQGSIKKWEGIVAGKVTDEGWTNCPLCQLFIHSECEGCPVAEKTGKTNCHGSPYIYWLGLDGHETTANTTELKKAARAELRFLKSLLPKE